MLLINYENVKEDLRETQKRIQQTTNPSGRKKIPRNLLPTVIDIMKRQTMRRDVLRIMQEELYAPPNDTISATEWRHLLDDIMKTRVVDAQMDKWFDTLRPCTENAGKLSREETASYWFRTAVWVLKYWATHFEPEVRKFIDKTTLYGASMHALYLSRPANPCPHKTIQRTCICTYRALCPETSIGTTLFSTYDYHAMRSEYATQPQIDAFSKLIDAYAYMYNTIHVIRSNIKHVPDCLSHAL